MQKQVKQLILVLSAAVIGGFLLTALMIMYYGPAGNYIAGQTILSPDVIERISFNDTHPTTGKTVNFVFDHNEFVYFDYLRGDWRQKELSSKEYEQFYQLIFSDKSLDSVSEEVLQFFQKPSPLALITSIRTDNVPQAKIFQVIQFTKEDYFRVKLHGQEEGKWVYFFRAHLYKNIMALFTAE